MSQPICDKCPARVVVTVWHYLLAINLLLLVEYHQACLLSTFQVVHLGKVRVKHQLFNCFAFGDYGETSSILARIRSVGCTHRIEAHRS